MPAETPTVDVVKGIAAGWNSPMMQSMRLDMLAGRSPELCNRCLEDERLGILSLRQLTNDLFRTHLGAALAATGLDGTASVGLIRELGIELGNRCNLKCRMCTPRASRATLSDYAKIHGLSKKDQRFQRFLGADWVASPEFHRSFAEHAATVERLTFSGGEPLVRKEMFALLEGLVERGRAPEIVLQYVTNLTTLPEGLFALWKQFKRVEMIVSLDGIGERIEYIRHPLDWLTMERNLKGLDAMAREINCKSLHANITVQAYNILTLDEIITYVANELPNFGRPNLDLLYRPEPLGIRVLPQELKQLATQRLEALLGRLRGGWPSHWGLDQVKVLCESLEGLLDHMNGSDRDDLLPEFCRWTEVLDQSRGENIKVAIPELASLFEKNGASA